MTTTMSPENLTRLTKAMESSDVRVRNWSADGEFVFAVYSRLDAFLGVITLTDDQIVACGRWYKKHEKILQKFAKAYAHR